FQAEDGIRDYKVTGVQTCSSDLTVVPSSSPLFSSSGLQITSALASLMMLLGFGAEYAYSPLSGSSVRKVNRLLRRHYEESLQERSEERRVGKECRKGCKK